MGWLKVNGRMSSSYVHMPCTHDVQFIRPLKSLTESLVVVGWTVWFRNFWLVVQKQTSAGHQEL
jgi:hypothetical protein